MVNVRILLISLTLLIGFLIASIQSFSEGVRENTSGINKKGRVVVAYLQSGGSRIPNPDIITHIIYSFGVFNDTNDGVVVPNPEKLNKLAELKKLNPHLSIILGIGGYKREGFSEMSGDISKRKRFVESCAEVIERYNLDGVDLDWEFPTTEAGGHTASPYDDVNYVALVKELREKLGKDQWISVYSNNSARWIKFEDMIPFLSYVNVSGYNLRVKGGHQSNLFSSGISGDWSVSKSIERHIKKGVPPEKILLGIPFFGRGASPFPGYLECYKIDRYSKDCKLMWDKEAKVPYYENREHDMVLSFDNPKSVEIKCDYVISNNLGGIFYWNYDADFLDHRLARTIWKCLSGDGK